MEPPPQYQLTFWANDRFDSDVDKPKRRNRQGPLWQRVHFHQGHTRGVIVASHDCGVRSRIQRHYDR